MKNETITNNIEFDNLNYFLQQNADVDWLKINLVKSKQLDQLNWGELDKDKLIRVIKAYQRLVRLLGEEDNSLILTLLKNNVHSAIQVAAMPKQKFYSQYSMIFEQQEKTSIERFYAKAVAIRSQVLVNHINRLQNNEPHNQTMKSLSV